MLRLTQDALVSGRSVSIDVAAVADFAKHLLTILIGVSASFAVAVRDELAAGVQGS